jgi:hypothetical protein
MPRYHFHIVDGLEVFDSLGATLPSDEAARFYAEKLAKDFGVRKERNFAQKP